jgi:putative nucleotidyltransferase with HDIG domain
LNIQLENTSFAIYHKHSLMFSYKEFNRLIDALAKKDYCTYIHSQYVVYYATMISNALNLADNIIKDIRLAGWLHDIGKIFIPNNILQKKGNLTFEEYEIIKKHVQYSVFILSRYDLYDNVQDIIKYHHEKFNGSGYPYEMSGNSIPLGARIIQIADACSAMTISRAYRKGMPFNEIMNEIELNSITQFDPYIVNLFKTYIKSKSY